MVEYWSSKPIVTGSSPVIRYTGITLYSAYGLFIFTESIWYYIS